MRIQPLKSCLVLLLLGAGLHAADDRFHVAAVADLGIPDAEARRELAAVGWVDFTNQTRVVLDGPGEAYVAQGGELRDFDSAPRDGAAAPPALPDDLREYNGLVVAIRVPSGSEAAGRIIYPQADQSKVTRFVWSDTLGGDRERLFLRVKRAHYQRLLQSDIPGAAWFRHQVRDIDQRLNSGRSNANLMPRRFFGRRTSDVADTYAFLSGGQALSENLQLDRELPERLGDAETDPAATVPVESIEGITVREFDWQPLVKDLQVEPDPLAAWIPADQHAVFFPSFEALVRLADSATAAGTPVLRAGEPRSEDAMTRERYEKQLCLSLNGAARFFGPQLIRSVALTGGDLYLRTGSDVAVVFEPVDGAALRTALETQILAAGSTHGAAKSTQGTIGGVAYRGVATVERDVCSYIATIGNAVVVTNSLVQLERIAQCVAQPETSLATLPEYTFFRHRYTRGEQSETALAVISDQTIRRWCGPRWRIASSRRTRAAAVLAELQAQQLAGFVAGNVAEQKIEAHFAISDARTFWVHGDGLRSEQYGTFDFQTPINELQLTHVTEEEANLYRRWRDGYQQNWSNFFDPIAIRFSLDAGRTAADLTVMPLINGSRYRWAMDLARQARLSPTSGDPHPESVFHGVLSIDANAPALRREFALLGTAGTMLGVDPLAWLGKSVSFYVDDDPVWRELLEWRKAHGDREPDREFVTTFVHRLPLAFHAEVSSGLRLTAFLTALRGFIDQAAPGMTSWETREYKGEPYVRIGPSARARSEIPEELAFYYSATGESFTLTLSEDLLKRAIDRRLQRDAAAKQPPPADAAAPPSPWLGESLSVNVDRRLADTLLMFFHREYQRAMQNQAWGNLPILNEWKRLFPSANPVELHAQFWGRRLVCPGGGEYRWNAEFQTMESTAYGHPGQPKEGPVFPVSLHDVREGRFGLDFEQHGLRARLVLLHGTPEPAKGP